MEKVEQEKQTDPRKQIPQESQEADELNEHFGVTE